MKKLNPTLLLIFFLHLTISNQLFGQQVLENSEFQQPDNKLIGFEEIFESLINSLDTLVEYSNESINLGSFSIRKLDRLFENANIDSGYLQLAKSLSFSNCTIIGKGLSDLKLKNIKFINCDIKSLSFTNLNAESLEITGGNLNTLRILNCGFGKLTLADLRNDNPLTGSLSVFKSKITKTLLISNNATYSNIGVFGSDLHDVRFSENKAWVTGMGDNLVQHEFLMLDENADEFRIRKNTFTSSDTLRTTIDIACDKLIFIENTLNVPVLLADSKVATRVEMANNEFTYPVDFHDVSFPEFNKYIPFTQFKNGFVVYVNLYGEESPDGANCYYCKLYQGQSDEELQDKTNFDKLVQSYEILFLGYKSTGDIESANASYIRIKDLYLNRLGYLYRTNGGFKHYFRWKLAQLLKFYTNHGTDPALSIVISIYVILIFAVFYVFYPSEWDVTSKKRLIANFKDFINSNEKGYFKPFTTLAIGFVISIINAITLSLNSFVTLGFGTIPTTGAARYVCIIQGFIGWFLLSIFTVSLINQILF